LGLLNQPNDVVVREDMLTVNGNDLIPGSKAGVFRRSIVRDLLHEDAVSSVTAQENA